MSGEKQKRFNELNLWERYDIIKKLSYPIWQQKGGATVSNIISFLISVMASVVAYCICKWLDGNNGDN